jgi:maltose phosphorylase
MGKIKNQYLSVNPWKIEEIGYKPKESMVSESLFSLANEYMGIRAFFEESHKEESLLGVYFNGIYTYAEKQSESAYKGITDKVHFMVNSVNWVKVQIKVNERIVNFSEIKHKDFYRSLDFKTGEMKRRYVALLDDGLEVELEFNRLLSMISPEYGYQTIAVKANQDIKLNLAFSLDFDTKHWGKFKFWQAKDKLINDEEAYILGVLPNKQRIMAMMDIDCNLDCKTDNFENKLEISREFSLDLTKELKAVFSRKFTAISERDIIKSENILKAQAFELLNKQPDYEKALQDNQEYYQHFWNNFDISITGNVEHQQGIRFCLFQLQQTYHGVDERNNIGAKGLTGEAYSGHAFWDTETFCIPFYLLNIPEAAKNLLLYRYHTLDQAKARAKELDCLGACYPIATLSGEESCDLWQHASLQPQPSTAVVYAIRHYLTLTNDYDFIRNYGMEMLIEISRYLYTRGDFNAKRTHFGFYGVMGPDEFQMMVNHNTYTNYLGKESFKFTLEMLDYLRNNYNDTYNEIIKKLNLSTQEISFWQEAMDKMYLLYDDSTKLYEQHLGYYELPHLDIHSISKTDFPLYHNWSYDRIYRNDMIKQPDVLMMMFLFNSNFTDEVLRANYDFYEVRCIHESSLSPSIHSILALQLNKQSEGYKFFEFATRLDLDNYNRNTKEGLHLTSIYAAWMNIVYGYGGLRSDSLPIKLNPSIPSSWESYSFNFTFRNTKIKVDVFKDRFVLTLNKDLSEAIIINNKKELLKQGKNTFEMKKV